MIRTLTIALCMAACIAASACGGDQPQAQSPEKNGDTATSAQTAPAGSAAGTTAAPAASAAPAVH